MSKIWFVSDWHFCHDKPFIYEPRGFKTIEEMNETIIKNHNSLVDYDDDVYCLGDCMLMDNEMGIKCIESLKGKIHIIRGNHCTDNRIELYNNCHNVVEVLGFAHQLKFNGYHFFLCHYPTMTANFDIDKPLKARLLSLSGHTHSKEIWDAAGGYNVALDAHNCYPVEITEIIKDFKEREKQRHELQF